MGRGRNEAHTTKLFIPSELKDASCLARDETAPDEQLSVTLESSALITSESAGCLPFSVEQRGRVGRQGLAARRRVG